MNLGLNLGFGPEATHTHATVKPHWLPIEIEQLPSILKKRNSITCDLRADEWLAKNHYGATANNYLKIRLGAIFPILKIMNLWVKRTRKR